MFDRDLTILKHLSELLLRMDPIELPIDRPNPTRMRGTTAGPEPPPVAHTTPTQEEDIDTALFTAHKGRIHAPSHRLIIMRGQPVVLLMVEALQAGYLLKWKTQHTMQRTGRELGARFFGDRERQSFCEADAK